MKSDAPPFSKEEAYDRIIEPLVNKIREHCKVLEISHVLAFDISPDPDAETGRLALSFDVDVNTAEELHVALDVFESHMLDDEDEPDDEEPEEEPPPVMVH